MKKLPKYKVCRRLGPGVYEKCQTEKYALAETRKQAKSPRTKRRRSLSEFGKQLLEKQRVRISYGIPERQFRNYVKKAGRAKAPAQELYSLLEKRLDNVVYRLGLAPTRRAARQMVSHGHITVNGRRMKVPSYQVLEKDTVAVREASKEKGLFTQNELKDTKIPQWLVFEPKQYSAKLTGTPALDEAKDFYDITSVIEFYSK